MIIMCGFDVAAGEWTEVPSRKKPKAKRDGPELNQEPVTTNEQTDQPQQVVIISILCVDRMIERYLCLASNRALPVFSSKM